MSRREHLDERDVGISAAATAALGAVLDEPAPVFIRHFVLSKTTRSACGIDGVEPNTNIGTSCEDAATCTVCREKIAERHAKNDLKALTRLRANRATGISVHFGIVRATRHRLVGAGLAEVRGPNLHITVAGLERLNPSKPAKGAA